MSGTPLMQMSNLALNLVDSRDRVQLFKWVNQKDCLRNKLQTNTVITWREHNRWFNKHYRSINQVLYLISIAGKKVGQIRLGMNQHSVDIDIYIDANYRQRGIAQQALNKALADCSNKIVAGIAVIQRMNKRSLALFQRMGFKPVDCKRNYIVLRKKLK